MPSIRSCVLVAIVVFVGAMVLFTEHSSFPFYYHQDEPGKVLQVIHRRKNFHHPLLMLTTAELARKTFLHGGAEDDPQRVTEMARTIMAAFAAASAALLALLATRLHGSLGGPRGGAADGDQSIALRAGSLLQGGPRLPVRNRRLRIGRAPLLDTEKPTISRAAGRGRGGRGGGKVRGGCVRARGRRHRRQHRRRDCAGALEARGQGRWNRPLDLAGSRLAGPQIAGAVRARLRRRDEQGSPRQSRDGGRGTARLLLRRPGRLRRPVGSGARDPLAGLRDLPPHARFPSPSGFSRASALVSMVVFSFTPKTSTRYYLPIAVTLCYLAAAGAFRWAALAGARWERSRMRRHRCSPSCCASERHGDNGATRRSCGWACRRTTARSWSERSRPFRRPRSSSRTRRPVCRSPSGSGTTRGSSPCSRRSSVRSRLATWARSPSCGRAG